MKERKRWGQKNYWHKRHNQFLSLSKITKLYFPWALGEKSLGYTTHTLTHTHACTHAQYAPILYFLPSQLQNVNVICQWKGTVKLWIWKQKYCMASRHQCSNMDHIKHIPLWFLGITRRADAHMTHIPVQNWKKKEKEAMSLKYTLVTRSILCLIFLMYVRIIQHLQ